MAQSLTGPTTSIGSRFQVLDVDSRCSIREFVQAQGLTFKKGRGFYEFTKTEDIQEYKEVVAQNRTTGVILYNEDARKVLGIPPGRCRCKPSSKEWLGFVQSTSVNRMLEEETKFLYEIEELAGVSI